MTTTPSNGSLRPGKGAHLDLTHATLEFMQECILDLWNAAGEEGEVDSLDALIDRGEGMQYLKDIAGSAMGWQKAKDNFGTKLYKSLPWGDGGEIRVTVVLNSRGELKLDVRYWFDPNNATPSWKQ